MNVIHQVNTKKQLWLYLHLPPPCFHMQVVKKEVGTMRIVCKYSNSCLVNTEIAVLKILEHFWKNICARVLI